MKKVFAEFDAKLDVASTSLFPKKGRNFRGSEGWAENSKNFTMDSSLTRAPLGFLSKFQREKFPQISACPLLTKADKFMGSQQPHHD